MLRRRGKNYYLDIYVNGKRYREALQTDNKYEALDKANKRRLIILGELGKAGITIESFGAQYLEWARATKPASAKREEQRIKKIIDFFKAQNVYCLADISVHKIEEFRIALKEKGLSRATINRYTQILRSMFYRAIDWEIYSGPNPVRKIKFYRERSPIKPLTKTQILKVLAASRMISRKPLSPLQAVFYDLVCFALNTGMRKSEVLNLKWEDIAGNDIAVKGKGERDRLIPLNETAKEIISRQPHLDEFVFPIPNRNQQDLFRRTVMQISKRAKIEWHFHLLRHVFASSLIEKGVDLITVSALLGHSKLFTSLIYSHTNSGQLRNAVNLLDSHKNSHKGERLQPNNLIVNNLQNHRGD